MLFKQREGNGWLRSKSLRRGREGGMTITEVVISMSLVSIMGIGMISASLAARNMAEFDKQRIAAMAYARGYLERVGRYDLYATLTPGDIALDNFNTPDTGDDLQASLQAKVFDVNADGTVGGELTEMPTTPQRVLVQVTVSWNRTGSLKSHRVSLTLSSYVSPTTSIQNP
ncbi:MAG: hypothetical protein NTX50_17815 [Candidatus Sumerlaeota bacterium]|nr:hypothetical protein [Candidatus Sumerlaeota bacterium]